MPPPSSASTSRMCSRRCVKCTSPAKSGKGREGELKPSPPRHFYLKDVSKKVRNKHPPPKEREGAGRRAKASPPPRRAYFKAVLHQCGGALTRLP